MTTKNRYFESCIKCDKDIDITAKPKEYSFDSEEGEYICRSCAKKSKQTCDYCEEQHATVLPSPYPGDVHFKICRQCWGIAMNQLGDHIGPFGSFYDTGDLPHYFD